MGCFSKVLPKPHCNYCMTMRELLIKWNQWGTYKYLYVTKWLLWMDCAMLCWSSMFRNIKWPGGYCLQEYHFAVEQWPGSTHWSVEALTCSTGCFFWWATERKGARENPSVEITGKESILGAGGTWIKDFQDVLCTSGVLYNDGSTER